MVNVQFEDTGSFSQYTSTADRRPGMIKILMNWGWAKDEKTANRILIAIIIVSITLSIYFIYSIFDRNSGTPEVIPDAVTNMQLPPRR